MITFQLWNLLIKFQIEIQLSRRRATLFRWIAELHGLDWFVFFLYQVLVASS